MPPLPLHRYGFALLLGLAAAASAQTVPAPRSAPTSVAREDPVELSPFEVTSSRDVGYQATNTVSGSRLNSRLKDTPAANPPIRPWDRADLRPARQAWFGASVIGR